jgi:hypothetical protein
MHHDRPIFLLQNNCFDRIGRSIQPCLDFCRLNGHDFIDRSMTAKFDPDAMGVQWSDWPGVIIYGSVGWMKRCRDSSLSPYCFYDSKAFAASTWIPVLRAEALNGDGSVLSVTELVQRLADGERLHVRPDSEDKAFSGGVYELESWNAMLEERRVEGQRLPAGDLACFVSSPKRIAAEHRCWFFAGRLIDISTYRKGGERHIQRCVDMRVFAEAQRLADIYLPLANAVMDIAETAAGCKVIEFNSINASGWYAADVDALLSSWSAMLISARALA